MLLDEAGVQVAGREGDTRSISHSSVLAPERRNPEDAFAVVNRLTQKAAMRLRKSGHYASRLSLAVRYLDGSRWDADMRLVDTQDTVTFLHALEKLWSGRPRDRRTILQVGMAFGDLVGEAGHTGSLFAAESKSKSLYETLDRLNAPPRLVVTDSQAFLKVAADTPPDVPMTSFSILMARFQGDLAEQVRGTLAIERLAAGDHVLVAETCTHHPIGDDIGRVKIPKWLGDYTGARISTSSSLCSSMEVHTLASCR